MAFKVVVDTDMGVDDAAALGWLSEQRRRPTEIVGVAAVWGNTSAEHAAINAAALLHALGRGDVPIAMGASAPLVGGATRVGALAHGRDGLWGARPALPALPAFESDITRFYRAVGARHPGATLIATGPLTNLARVVAEDREALEAFASIVVLGGARHHGTMTPVSETNFWHDPEAADRVLMAGLPITLVTRDAHRAFALSSESVERVCSGSSLLAKQLARPLGAYATAQRRFGEGVHLGDVVAAILAVEPAYATQSIDALVRVVPSTAPFARGQSVMAVTPTEKLTMVDGGAAIGALVERLVDMPEQDVRPALGAILARARDNARVVLEVDVEAIREAFLEVLT